MAVQVLCPNPLCGASYSASDPRASDASRCRACGQDLRPGTVDDRSRTGTVSGDSDPGAADGPRAGPVGLGPGSIFGRYRIERPLGRGGMGSVLLARDTQLERTVALKIPDLEPRDSGRARERFLREARAAAALDHPGLCPVFDVGEVEGVPYLTMPYIEGRSLAEAIGGEAPTPLRQAAAIVRKLALALQEAHDRGVVHRDLKPTNILVNRRRELVVVDFGLARRDGSEIRLTLTGAVLGTPAYMSPEQAACEADLGPSTDIYSLGVVLYEILTGRLPFEGPAALVLGRIMVVEPDPPSTHRPDLDARLEAICLKAMAKRPADRYASMADLAADLADYLRADSASTSGELPAVDAPATVEAGRGRTGGESLVNQLIAEIVPNSGAISIRGPAARAPVPVARGGKGRSTRLRWIIVGAAGAAAFFLLLGLVIRVATDRGTLRIELSDPDAEVDVRIDGDTVDLAGLGEPLRLRVGEHRLEVTGKDFESVGNSFTLKRSEVKILDVRLVPKPTAPDLADHATPAPTEPPLATEGPEGMRPPSTTAATAASPAAGSSRGAEETPIVMRALAELKTGRFAAAGRILDEVGLAERGWEWSYARALLDARERPADPNGVKAGVLVYPHPKFVTAVTFSPDGLKVATTGSDGVARVFDATREGTPLLSFPAGEGPTSVAIAPDGKQIAVGSVDTYLRIWDLGSGRFLKHWKHPHQVAGVAFSPDGRRIAAACGDLTVHVWDVTTNEKDPREIAILGRRPPVLPEKFGQDVAFSPDGGRLVSMTSVDTITVRDIKDASRRIDLRGHMGTLGKVAFSPDGKRVASSADDGTVRIWDLDQAREVRRFGGHRGPMVGLAYSPDGRRLATGSVDRPLRIWDTATGQELLWSDIACGSIWSVAFSPDGSRVASGGPDGKLRIWSVVPSPSPGPTIRSTPDANSEWEPLFNNKDTSGWKTYPGEPDRWKVVDGILTGGGPWSNLFTIRGDYRDFHLRIEARIRDGDNSGVFMRVPFGPGYMRGYEAEINSTDRADGQRTGSLRHFAPVEVSPVPPDTWFTLEVIAEGNHIIVKVDGKTTADVTDANISFSSGHIALQQLREGSTAEFRKVEVRRLRPDTGRSPTTPAPASLPTPGHVWTRSHPGVVSVVAFDPKRPRIASAHSWAGKVQVADLKTGAPLFELAGHTHQIWALTYSPDGTQIATGTLANWNDTNDLERRVRIWDAARGTLRHILLGRGGIEYSPDGRSIATGSDRGEIVLYDSATGSQLKGLAMDVNADKRWAFSPIGRTIASIGGQGNDSLRIWDVDRGREAGRFPISEGAYRVRYFPDGKRLLGVSPAGLRVWDAGTGAEVLKIDTKLYPHCLAISPDGRWIFAGAEDGTIHAWDAGSGREVLQMSAHSKGVWGLACSPDGRRLATGAYDQTTKLWDLSGGTPPTPGASEKTAAPRPASSPVEEIRIGGTK